MSTSQTGGTRRVNPYWTEAGERSPAGQLMDDIARRLDQTADLRHRDPRAPYLYAMQGAVVLVAKDAPEHLWPAR